MDRNEITNEEIFNQLQNSERSTENQDKTFTKRNLVYFGYEIYS